eukprot:s2339_g2.t1
MHYFHAGGSPAPCARAAWAFDEPEPEAPTFGFAESPSSPAMDRTRSLGSTQAPPTMFEPSVWEFPKIGGSLAFL